MIIKIFSTILIIASIALVFVSRDELSNYIVNEERNDIVDENGESQLQKLNVVPIINHPSESIGSTKDIETTRIMGSCDMEVGALNSETLFFDKLNSNNTNAKNTVHKYVDETSTISSELVTLHNGISKSNVTFSNDATVTECAFVDTFVNSKKYNIPEIVYDYDPLVLTESLSGFSFIINESKTSVEYPEKSDCKSLYFRINGRHVII